MVKFSVKLLPPTWDMLISRLKLFLDFENTEAAKAFNKAFKDSTGVVVHH